MSARIRVAWISRHAMLPSQRAALGPDVEIIPEVTPFASAEEIARRVRALGCQDLAVVAPLSVLGRLCDLGLRPLWAEMECLPVDDPRVETRAQGRGYRFVRWRRVAKLHLEFEPGDAAPRATL